MARVQGVKEKLQVPQYDAYLVSDKDAQKKTFQDFMTDPRMIRFFVDVQNKTRLETNLQAAGVLPSQNSFEVRAMRVVSSSVSKMKHNGGAEDLSDSEFLAELIYNSVTSLVVGEKVMIEMPTFWFPSGSGVSPGRSGVSNHGEPDPRATFSLAEAVPIDPGQNFRVEMLFPQGVPPKVANALGPLRLWVVLDGYLTRDVQ